MKKPQDKPVKEEQEELYSCHFRVYPNKIQHKTLSNYLFVTQKFRNLAVAFCEERRIERLSWIQKHPVLSKNWIPGEMVGDDVSVCSKELTLELNQAKKEITFLWGLNPHARNFSEVLRGHMDKLSKEEQAEIPFALFLTVHRTVLDQVLQDLSKTYQKAKKDRMEKLKKAAGFPQKRKHSYSSSVRFQIPSSKNKTYKKHWQAGFIFVPSVGLLKFRDNKSLPNTPPEMITISRNPAGQFHVSFLDKDSAGSEKVWQDLPQEEIKINDKTKKVPSIDAVDVGLKTLGTTTKKEISRQKYTKKYERNLRHANKSLSRKHKGSSRYKKAKLTLGRVHLKISNSRDDYLKKEAKGLVEENAIICLEDLTLSFMLRNTNLSKDAHDSALGKFKTLIYQNAKKLGHLVIECGRFDPSSKTCSACGYYYKDLTLNERHWACPGCNTVLLRDHNAAVNIRSMALQKAIKTLSASGNDAGALSPHRLHPKLITFIERGGLASMLKAFKGLNVSQPCEALVLPQKALEN